jgi:DUF1680 family protein
MKEYQPISYMQTDVTGGFWQRKQALIRDVTIFSVRDRFADTGRFRAFKFDWTEGSDIPKPHFFWDSDIAKWLESAAYLLQKAPNAELEAQVEEVIDDIEAHQDETGYFNIFHTVAEPENRFRIRDHHELYCLGHLIEAAVAYFEATGRDRFLRILDRYIDYVIRVFTVERSAGFQTPGHEEIELALIRLYRLRGDKKYLDLAMFFLNKRGNTDEGLTDWANGSYNQSHLPVRRQRTAEGHCVRACYLYSAMADAAKETGDEDLLDACRALFRDIAERKMYVTGGIGSSHCGEAFTIPYDLPNDTAYNETCASIALSMFADRMKLIDLDSKYADVVELELYNGALAGLSLDGKSFFYENPLEINLADHTRHTSVNDHDRLPITQRLEVFDCSCCPPNVTRYFASIGGSLYSASDDAILVHQFMESTADVNGAAIRMETNYPLDGRVRLTLQGARGKQLLVRVPGWCQSFSFSAPYTMQRGYAATEVPADDFTLEIDFAMEPLFLAAHPAVRADAGRLALQYGPIVYCLEAVDNGDPLSALTVDVKGEAVAAYDPFFGANVITLPGFRAASDLLYAPPGQTRQTPVSVRFIPYYGFANRGESDMTVWFRPAASK